MKSTSFTSFPPLTIKRLDSKGKFTELNKMFFMTEVPYRNVPFAFLIPILNYFRRL